MTEDRGQKTDDRLQMAAGSIIEKETNEHRTLNVQHRILYPARGESLCRTVNL